MPADQFAVTGPLREAYESVDWAATPLGPPQRWSPALRSTLDTTLPTRFPASVLWGPDHVLAYNEAYAEMIGAKHPHALGRPAKEIFPEAWDILEPMVRQVLDEDRPTWARDALIPLERAGFMEECYFTFSCSPVHGEDGRVEGIVDIAAETTAHVVAARRLRLLSRLQGALAEVDATADVPVRAHAVFDTDHADLPEAELRLEPVAEEDRREAMVLALPTSLPAVAEATLSVRPSPFLPLDEDYRGFLSLVATSLAQALDRVAGLEAERDFSAALQRSLLTEPPASRHVEIAVRYQPAAEVAQIGGDWYDAFLTPDGAMTLMVGDVAGHDRDAAAGMAQVRNLARGMAWTVGESPAAVLSLLDQAMAGLEVVSVATGVVARVERLDAGRMLVRWSNAGHPFPVVLHPDGSTKLLETRPDLLLGLDAAGERSEHELVLEPGSSLVLYTDGLVERRGVPLDVSLGWLTDALRDRQGLGAEQLCDHLLGLLHGRAEDDVAMLVMRAASTGR